jgi:hypothetical protein
MKLGLRDLDVHGSSTPSSSSLVGETSGEASRGVASACPAQLAPLGLTEDCVLCAMIECTYI